MRRYNPCSDARTDPDGSVRNPTTMSSEAEKERIRKVMEESARRIPVPMAVRRRELRRLRRRCEELAPQFPDLWHFYAEAPFDSPVLEQDIPYYITELNGLLYPAHGDPVPAADEQLSLLELGKGADGRLVQHLHLLHGRLSALRAARPPQSSVIQSLENLIDGLDLDVWRALLQEDSPHPVLRRHALALMHRLAWQQRPGSPLRAYRTSWTAGANLHVSGGCVAVIDRGFDFPYDPADAERVLAVWGETGQHEKIRAVRERIGSPPRHFLSALRPDLFSAIAATIDLLLDATGSQAAPGAVKTTKQVVPPPPPNRFAKCAKGWEIAYGSEKDTFGDRKGLQDLYTLLSRPYEKIHVLELCTGESLLQRADTVAHAYADREMERDLKAKWASMSDDERRFAEKHYGKAIRGTGRRREFTKNSERARRAVGKRISEAIDEISKHMPQLAMHLRVAVELSVYCTYAPADPRPHWHLH